MENNELVLIHLFCQHTEIDTSFIYTLEDYGLVQLVIEENDTYLPLEEIQNVELLARLHYELGINLEGIDVVSNLLQQIKDLKKEMTRLRNRLAVYE